MAQQTSTIYKQPAYRWGAVSLFATIAIILGALAFEYIGGYKPCPLCLQQRYAYYLAIPLLFLALVLLSVGNRPWSVALLFLVSLAFLANSAFGVYHAGAEWGYWDAPSTCASTGQVLSGGNLRAALQSAEIVDCSKPALVILGLSLAGWNAIVSLCIAIGCLKAAFYASEQQ